jgi:hypothetical protein
MPRGATSTKAAISPRMKQAWRHYESGDVVVARREAKEILSASPSALDAAQAEDLLERTGVSKIALYYALGAALVISLLIVLAVLRG